MGDNDREKTGKIRGALQKLRAVKNIEIIVCIILIAVILALYGVVKATKDKGDDTQASGSVAVAEEGDAERLTRVLSDIKGAGRVSVFISYDGTNEVVYAYDTKVNTTVREDNSGGSTLTTTTTEESSVPVFITVDGEKMPLISKTLAPKILGVVIVAEGASDIAVRLQLMRAAATALKIDENIIEIFIMN